MGKKLARLTPNIVDFIDKTSVPQLHALMKYLKLFISPDTGVMHVVCSANIPLIALFGHTNIKRTGPYPATLKDLTILQEKSMEDISVEKVFDTTVKKIKENQ